MDQNFLRLVARTVLRVSRERLQVRVVPRLSELDSASGRIALVAARDATMIAVPAARVVCARRAVPLVEEHLQGGETDDNDGHGCLDGGPESQPDGLRVGVGGVGDDDANDGEDYDDDAEADDGADGEFLFARALDDPEEFPWEEDDERV